jgi:hypothetical protein
MDLDEVPAPGAIDSGSWEHDVRRLAEHFPSVSTAIIERMVTDTYAHLSALADAGAA